MKYVLFSMIGYLSGSVLYGYLLPRILKKVDVREKSEDGNPGAANAFKFAGVPCGIVVIILEILKAFIPVYFATRVLDISNLKFAIVLAAPVIGHAYPLFFRGNGGKSIAASFGSLLGIVPSLKPVILLAGLYLVFSLVIVVNPHFYRSVITFTIFSVGCFYVEPIISIRAGSFLISLIVVAKHFVRYQGEHLEVHLVGKHVRA